MMMSCRHPDLEESLLRYFGDHATPSHLKLADTPGDDTTRLIHYCLESGGISPFPLVAVRNVFVLPGKPVLWVLGAEQCGHFSVSWCCAGGAVRKHELGMEHAGSRPQ